MSMTLMSSSYCVFFFFQAEDGIRDLTVTGVQTCALPIWQRARVKRQELAFTGHPRHHEGLVERHAEFADLPAADLDRHAIHAHHPVGRRINRQLDLVTQHADRARIDGRRSGKGQDGAGRPLKQDNDDHSPEEDHASPSSASTKASGSKAWRSSMPSPTPMYRSGSPSSPATARTMPPLAVPSSLVRITPVTPSAS